MGSISSCLEDDNTPPRPRVNNYDQSRLKTYDIMRSVESMPTESTKYRILRGFDHFEQFTKEVKSTDLVFFYFTGSKNEQGTSWCSDCVEAEPFVLAAADKHVKESTNFIIVDVGNRNFWKDMRNSFRISPPLISVIPSLVRWNGPQRLEGSQCQKDDLLEMFFTDDI